MCYKHFLVLSKSEKIIYPYFTLYLLAFLEYLQLKLYPSDQLETLGLKEVFKRKQIKNTAFSTKTHLSHSFKNEEVKEKI